MMRAVLKAHGCTDRTVVLADSFAGLATPLGEDAPEDRRVRWDRFTELAASEAEVRANFERYGLLDDQGRFVRGWFRDTMPSLAGGRWSLVRLDGDTYTSTMDALHALYPSLTPGGYLIVDDYGPADTGQPAGTCRRAVDEFRASQGIDEQIQRIDWDRRALASRRYLIAPSGAKAAHCSGPINAVRDSAFDSRERWAP